MGRRGSARQQALGTRLDYSVDGVEATSGA